MTVALAPVAAALAALVAPTAPPVAAAAAPSPEAPRAAAPAPAAAPATTCGLADAYLSVRLAGGVDRDLRWRAAQMECEGMRRPDGKGLRVSFAGESAAERLTFVFGVPELAEGASARAVPVNVTVIRSGGRVYGTRGPDKCTLDSVRQTPLGPAPNGRRWRIEARGFCLEPARGVGDANDAILPATFDFAGQVTWEADPPEPPRP